MSKVDVSVQQEIYAPLSAAPHVVLLGAGASKAALPHGDRRSRQVPLLRDVAAELDLAALFPGDLRELANEDFEAAYSRLYERDPGLTADIDTQTRRYFADLQLPDQPTIYDALLLSLRNKDAAFTFNWDPFLLQAHRRLVAAGVSEAVLPRIHFLHGNVLVGYCAEHRLRGVTEATCVRCGQTLAPSRLLFPVEQKDYQDGLMIEQEWTAVQEYLRRCFMLTVFGYSAPKSDVEAKQLLTDAWGDVNDRRLEQTEVIVRPGADHDQVREVWSPFIHTHHYEIHESFYESWIGSHPRRTLEAFIHQEVEAEFIEENPVPSDFATVPDLVRWFTPLLDAERRYFEPLEGTH